MATAYPTDFVGGPCNGITKLFTRAELNIGSVVCGGTLYSLTPITATSWRAVPEKSAGAAAAPSAPSPSADFSHAWTRLMHTLSFYVPEQLNRQRVAMQRIRRAVK